MKKISFFLSFDSISKPKVKYFHFFFIYYLITTCICKIHLYQSFFIRQIIKKMKNINFLSEKRIKNTFDDYLKKLKINKKN